jgi:hypothetical protein
MSVTNLLSGDGAVEGVAVDEDGLARALAVRLQHVDRLDRVQVLLLLLVLSHLRSNVDFLNYISPKNRNNGLQNTTIRAKIIMLASTSIFFKFLILHTAEQKLKNECPVAGGTNEYLLIFVYFLIPVMA